MTSHSFVATRRTFLHGYFCLVSGSVRFLIEYVYAAILFSCSCLTLSLFFLPFPLPPLKGHYFQMCLPVSASADGRCSSAAPENQPTQKKWAKKILCGKTKVDDIRGEKVAALFGKSHTESDKNSTEESSSFCFFSSPLFFVFLGFLSV